MGTLTGLMGLARHALDADQQAINVTSNNVANQNTVGYSRQTVSFAATDSVSLNGFSGNGEGVDVTVTSQRDRVLEQRLQQTTQSSAASSARLSALQDVQQMFGMSSTQTNASATALGSAVDGFFASLTALSANPYGRGDEDGGAGCGADVGFGVQHGGERLAERDGAVEFADWHGGFAD